MRAARIVIFSSTAVVVVIIATGTYFMPFTDLLTAIGLPAGRLSQGILSTVVGFLLYGATAKIRLASIHNLYKKYRKTAAQDIVNDIVENHSFRVYLANLVRKYRLFKATPFEFSLFSKIYFTEELFKQRQVVIDAKKLQVTSRLNAHFAKHNYIKAKHGDKPELDPNLQAQITELTQSISFLQRRFENYKSQEKKTARKASKFATAELFV